MIKIYYPNTFINERIYIIEVLFGEFLGLNFEAISYGGTEYKIILDNHAQIDIKDGFFGSQNQNYLDIVNIPEKMKYTSNQFLTEKDIPIIFGTEQLEVNEKYIQCGIDIFASSFFMLTRWEEYVNKVRDNHNRFPAIESFSYKNGFLSRPVVNEYVEMVWNMLTFLGEVQNRKSRNFKYIITHDVDSIVYWRDINRMIQILIGDLVKRNSIPIFLEHLIELAQVKAGKKKDPFDSFDYIMDLSEAANIKSHFYFMSGGVTKFDNYYQIDENASLKIINKIKERNHVIGFHPSYNAYNDPIQWKKEKILLEETANLTVTEGRQHFLRFEAPHTWNIWNDNGFEMDCTLGYADKEGFRCGTCYEYPVFDFIKRKKLSLKEYPLILMEASFLAYQSVSPQYMEQNTFQLIDKVKKYKGNFVYLWHNSSFNIPSWKPFQYVYENVLKSYQQ
jgi:hypothetical protein